mmetsp:Transcript_98895/g.318935  ORF Transcript_98895/g.318935 Transcript_98895/m.318935 type:complete len:243 (+) Transcript_98895:395-1123(+)
MLEERTRSVVAVVALETGGGTLSPTRMGPMTMPPPMPQTAASRPARKLQRTRGRASSRKSRPSSSTGGFSLSCSAYQSAKPPRQSAAPMTSAHHCGAQSSKSRPLQRTTERQKSQTKKSLHLASLMRSTASSRSPGAEDALSEPEPEPDSAEEESGFSTSARALCALSWLPFSFSCALIFFAEARPLRAASVSTMQSSTSSAAGGATACTTLPTCAPAMSAGPMRQASSKSTRGRAGRRGWE